MCSSVHFFWEGASPASVRCGAQQLQLVRLQQKPICSLRQRRPGNMFLPIRADRNHLRTLRRRILPQLVEQIHTVHVGHHDIQEQNVRLFRLELGQRFKPTTCLGPQQAISDSSSNASFSRSFWIGSSSAISTRIFAFSFIQPTHSSGAARQKARAPDVLHNPPHGARLHRIFPQENKKTGKSPPAYRRLPGRIAWSRLRPAAP